jgi:hypothetical protein
MKEDTQRTIGSLLSEDYGRDAIHIAVAPVIATQRLKPGQHVGLVADGQAGSVEPTLGIVDPYLDADVKKGERFWLFLYPNTITSLRHEWTHPSFATAVTPTVRISQTDHVAKSRGWIEAHAAELDLTVNMLMRNAEEWLKYDEHTIQQGSEHWRDTFNPIEFWHHYEIVTGTVVPPDKKHSFYCCTC